jgi:hypothetical protein
MQAHFLIDTAYTPRGSHCKFAVLRAGFINIGVWMAPSEFFRHVFVRIPELCGRKGEPALETLRRPGLSVIPTCGAHHDRVRSAPAQHTSELWSLAQVRSIQFLRLLSLSAAQHARAGLRSFRNADLLNNLLFHLNQASFPTVEQLPEGLECRCAVNWWTTSDGSGISKKCF